MNFFNGYESISGAQAEKMQSRALADSRYLHKLVCDGWSLPLSLQLKLFELSDMSTLISYIAKHQLDEEAEIRLLELADDVLEEYISRHAVLLGRTLISQEFILKLFELPETSAKMHLEHCIREGSWLSPKVQVKMMETPNIGQDLLLRYLVPYTKYAKWINEQKKEEIPLCGEAQVKLLELPNAREVIWFLTQTWKLCPKAEDLARKKGLI